MLSLDVVHGDFSTRFWGQKDFRREGDGEDGVTNGCGTHSLATRPCSSQEALVDEVWAWREDGRR